MTAIWIPRILTLNIINMGNFIKLQSTIQMLCMQMQMEYIWNTFSFCPKQQHIIREKRVNRVFSFLKSWRVFSSLAANFDSIFAG